MPNRVVVVGSSNTDMILQVPKIPRPGETLLGKHFSIAGGGKGANQAIAAARAGAEVYFITKVGTDLFGDQMRKNFEQDGIRTPFVFQDSTASSGVALIFVADDGENSIGVAPGANALLTPADIESARAPIESADILLMQLEVPLDTIRAAASIAVEKNVKVILNPAPAQSLPDDLLARVNILTPNETEAELLTGIPVIDESSAKKAARDLIRRGPSTVIITLGAKGSFLCTADFERVIPSFSVKAVDTTAAGDVFNGALAVALSQKQPLQFAVCWASAAAALSVTKLGAQPSAPTRNDIETLFNSGNLNPQ